MKLVKTNYKNSNTNYDCIDTRLKNPIDISEIKFSRHSINNLLTEISTSYNTSDEKYLKSNTNSNNFETAENFAKVKRILNFYDNNPPKEMVNKRYISIQNEDTLKNNYGYTNYLASFQFGQYFLRNTLEIKKDPLYLVSFTNKNKNKCMKKKLSNSPKNCAHTNNSSVHNNDFLSENKILNKKTNYKDIALNTDFDLEDYSKDLKNNVEKNCLTSKNDLKKIQKSNHLISNSIFNKNNSIKQSVTSNFSVNELPEINFDTSAGTNVFTNNIISTKKRKIKQKNASESTIVTTKPVSIATRPESYKSVFYPNSTHSKDFKQKNFIYKNRTKEDNGKLIFDLTSLLIAKSKVSNAK